MLWHVVDVLAVILALAIVLIVAPVLFGPWRRRLADLFRPGAQSKASPRRDSSSSS